MKAKAKCPFQTKAATPRRCRFTSHYQPFRHPRADGNPSSIPTVTEVRLHRGLVRDSAQSRQLLILRPRMVRALSPVSTSRE
jgi:hypothetical protein